MKYYTQEFFDKWINQLVPERPLSQEIEVQEPDPLKVQRAFLEVFRKNNIKVRITNKKRKSAQK